MQDDALIRQAQNGDRDAMEAILERHYDTLYRFAYRWCGQASDAQDIAQLACIKLARSIDQFRFESAFSSWLYRIVISCARDHSRSESRHSAGDATVDDLPAVDDPEQQVHHWQLLASLENLPDGIKETLLLVHAEGLTHREAARVLAVKESTVSWRLHEFRKQFGAGAAGRELL